MGTRLFVAGLAWRTTEEALMHHLAVVGEVTWLHLVTDRDTGRSKGYAFVEMGSPEEAARAVTELNGRPLDDRELTVEEALPRPDRRPNPLGGVGSAHGERRDRRPARQAGSARGAW